MARTDSYPNYAAKYSDGSQVVANSTQCNWGLTNTCIVFSVVCLTCLTAVPSKKHAAEPDFVPIPHHPKIVQNYTIIWPTQVLQPAKSYCDRGSNPGPSAHQTQALECEADWRIVRNVLGGKSEVYQEYTSMEGLFTVIPLDHHSNLNIGMFA